MGKITTVYYKEVNPQECSTALASEFYFHYNLMGEHPSLAQDYEEYELSQMHTRNKIIGDALKHGEIPSHPIMNSTIFGVSSVKNKTVLITEY